MSENLTNGIAAHKAGDKVTARRLFAQALKEDPNSERAWQWMYNASETDVERERCLSEILRINPGNTKAREMLSKPTAEPLRKKCPHCAEQILAEAEVCRYCGKSVNPHEVRTEKINRVANQLNYIGCVMTVLGVGGLCIILAFAFL